MTVVQPHTLDPLYGAVPPTGPGPVFSIRDEANSPSSISMYTSSDCEMLRVSKEGFWVRGVKIPQDDKEAETVYNAFLQWMSHMALTRNY